MVDPSGRESTETAATVVVRGKRPRRRGRPIFVAVFAGILWLIGQGIGWFGSGPIGEGGDADRFDGGTSSVGVATESSSSADLSVVVPDEEGRGAQPVKRVLRANERVDTSTVIDKPVPDVDPDAAHQSSSGVSVDRFSSWIALLESYLKEMDLGNASASLQRLLSQSLSSEQREQVAVLEAQLLPLLQACESRILAHVRSGELLAANDEAAQLVVADVWRPGSILAGLPGFVIAENWQADVVIGTATIPAPVPLSLSRRVRVRWRDEIHQGVVASSSPHRVTTKLRSEDRQVFPTVKVVACEPVESTATEAVEMGLVALHEGAPRLARLWLLRAFLLAKELPPRGLLLRELLN